MFNNAENYWKLPHGIGYPLSRHADLNQDLKVFFVIIHMFIVIT